MSGSSARIWMQLGFAWVAMRKRDFDQAVEHLRQMQVRNAAPAACIEMALLTAMLHRKCDTEESNRWLKIAKSTLEDPSLTALERAYLNARWVDQKAGRLLCPCPDEPLDPQAALALYESIPNLEGSPAYVLCHRHHGIAWCHYQLGHESEATAHAHQSILQAGDSGSLRLRVMTLRALARIEGFAGEIARQRALAITRHLEEEGRQVRIRERKGL